MSRDRSVGQVSALFSSIPQILAHQAGRIPDAPAILAPGRNALSYGLLHQHVEEMGSILRSVGIGRHDRVVVALPNGPELAVAILIVEANAICAPVNPAYSTEELVRYFTDVQPRAVIVMAGIDGSARRAANSCRLRIFELSAVERNEAGLFTLITDHERGSSHEPVKHDDVALLLTTSGTTSQPKLVTLTHANICASASATVAALALKETDRCLNVLPLFHGHGLNGTVMATLAAGASVVCAHRPEPDSFFDWLATFEPTWFTAVPTIHQAILAWVRRNPERVPRHHMRFIRSSSAPLPIRVLMDLERVFETPVIVYYGMTEVASAPIACSPLPPRKHKAGSVGVAIGLDVAIMNEEGVRLSEGVVGQVAVRGDSLMPGYAGDSIANQTAFARGWLLTGDNGFFDADGYLFLTGRSKETINRGGEKISPQQIDEVLLEHPAVAEAATFAIAHPTLGEDLAAAVVLQPDTVVTAEDIRRFVIGRIADFKIPRQVLIVSELPRGPTGKVQRIGLAARLGLEGSADVPRAFIAPRTQLEQKLAEVWQEILHIDQVSIKDNFFTLGGDSLSIAQVLARVFETMQLEVEPSLFFEKLTLADIAQHLEVVAASNHPVQPLPKYAYEIRGVGTPASIAQERLCKLQLLLPDLPLFNILYALRITTALDVSVLELSFNELIRRHAILRTTFAKVDSQYEQIVAPSLTLNLSVDDLSALTEPEKTTFGHQIIESEALHRFDLIKGPLLRVRLLLLAENEATLLITIHQAVIDGWSLGVIKDELVALYDSLSIGQAASLTAPMLQYGDFAHWQRCWQSHPDLVAQLRYWRKQLCDPMPAMELVPAHHRQPTDGIRTGRRELTLPPSLLEEAKRFSLREAGTLFMTLVVAMKVLMHLYLGQEDLRVATLVANRNRPGTERLIGRLANTVMLRTNLGGDPSLREVMQRVRATTLAAFAHQDLPFEELARSLSPEPALKMAALSPVMVVLQNASLRSMRRVGQRLTLEEADPTMSLPLVTATAFDVALTMHETAQGLASSCVFKSDLFDDNVIDELLWNFQSVLEQMVTQPDRRISTVCVRTNQYLPRSPLLT